MASQPHADDFSDRLSRISTRWSLVGAAHGTADTGAAEARRELLMGYSGCVYRYLLGAVRDCDAAEDLAHEFALRMLRGDMQRADPERGRFRDYVRRVLINLVNDHFREQGRRPHQAPSAWEPASPEDENHSTAAFEDCLRDDLMHRTWRALEAKNQNQYAVLFTHVQQLDLTSREIAARLAESSGESFTATGVRKTLERARKSFAELLIDQVSATMEDGSDERIEQELKDLGLLGYCASAWQARKCATATDA